MELDLSHFFRMLRRGWVVLVAGVLIGSAAGAGYVALKAPEYTATARLFVSTQSASSVTDLNQGSNFTQQIVSSYAQVAVSPIVLDRVRRELGLREPVATLASSLEASAPAATVIMDITAKRQSPRQAAEVANATARNLASVVAELSPDTTGAQSPVKLSIIQSATPPLAPTTPNWRIQVPISAMIGLLLSVLALTVMHARDTKVRQEADIEQLTNIPLIGHTIRERGFTGRPLAMLDQSAKRANAERYRTIQANLRYLAATGENRIILITSSIEGEGKSTTAANLAIAMADAGQRILLVDADLRRPTLQNHFQLENALGFSDALARVTAVGNVVQQTGHANLDVLPSGAIPPNPSELLQTPIALELLQQFADDYDVLVIDAPPLLPVADAAILAHHASATIMVAAAGRLRRRQLAGAIERLALVGLSPSGVILTMKPEREAAGEYDYTYGYAYSSSRGY